MKEKDINIVRPSTQRPSIIIDDSMKTYTEENSRFIKRKMDLARAILSKYPLPAFKDASATKNAEK